MKVENFLCTCMLVCTGMFASCSNTPKEEPISSVVERGLDRAEHQSLLMAKKLEPMEGKLPKSIKNDSLETSDYSWWCSGFYPGVLWYLYENNPTPELKKYAEEFTGRIEKAKNIKYSHDLGFMINCSYGNGYRLTQNEAYKDVMITGANSLITRYSDKTGLIRSWDFNADIWQFPVIIDNMMNLEFLMRATDLTGDPKYKQIAISHADKTLKNHFRDDYSCYHVVSYDTITGEPHKKQTHQGYADESAWARGQAWALYGYTMMYRETKKPEYLNQATNVAKFLMNHPAMPSDKIPYWDFDAPNIPNEPRDASAAAVMASALIELSQLNPGEFGDQCLKYAEDQIRSLTSSEYLAAEGENCDFILKHCTGHKPGNSEVDVPLSYADYYYVEALLRLKNLIK